MSYIDDILTEDDRPIREVKTPEWKCGRVYVRSLSALEMMTLDSAVENKSKEEQMALQLSAFLCDDAGNRVCTLEQGKALAGKSADAVWRIMKAGSNLNGQSREAQDEAREKS